MAADRYVVTLYKRNHTVEGVYGVFADLEDAHAFGKCSGAGRYRISVIRKPKAGLFEERQAPRRRSREE